MAATVSISESNGAGQTVTASITNSNMGSTDAVNLVAATYPITAGTRSYAKYQRFNVTNMGTSSAIQNLKVWRTTNLSGSDTHLTNAGETTNYSQLGYVQPVNVAITSVDNAMPTTAPSTANLGIATSLSGVLSATGYSDYLIHQLVVASDTTAGTSCTMNYSYDEVA